MGEAPEVLHYGDGTDAIRDYQAESVIGFVSGTDNPVVPKRKNWPMECVASGVHASQAQDLRDHFRKHNLTVEVKPNGNPVYEDSAQRKKALKCRGFFDKASYC